MKLFRHIELPLFGKQFGKMKDSKVPEDSMVQVKPFVSRPGSNSVL